MEVMEMEDKIVEVFNDILKKYDYEILKLKHGCYGLSYWKSDTKLCMLWSSFDEMLFDLDKEHITIFDYFNDRAVELIGFKYMTRNIEYLESPIPIPEGLQYCDVLYQEIEFLKSSCLEELVMKIQLCGGKIR